jgi:hypothetical protein
MGYGKYWRMVARLAFCEALKDTRLDSLPSALASLLAQSVLAIVIWFFSGHAFPPGTLLNRALTAALPFCALPVAFLIRLTTVPPKLWREQLTDREESAREAAAELDKLKKGATTTARRQAFKDALAIKMRSAKDLLKTPGITIPNAPDADARAWVHSTHKLILTALGDGEAELFLSDAGYTFYSSDGPIVSLIKGRLRRIGDLMHRVDALEIKPEFDPKDLALEI